MKSLDYDFKEKKRKEEKRTSYKNFTALFEIFNVAFFKIQALSVVTLNYKNNFKMRQQLVNNVSVKFLLKTTRITDNR